LLIVLNKVLLVVEWLEAAVVHELMSAYNVDCLLRGS